MFSYSIHLCLIVAGKRGGRKEGKMTEFITLLFFGIPVAICGLITVAALADGGGVRTSGLRGRIAGSIYRNDPPPDYVEPLPDIEEDPLAIEIEDAWFLSRGGQIDQVQLPSGKTVKIRIPPLIDSGKLPRSEITHKQAPESPQMDEALKKHWEHIDLVQSVAEENSGLSPTSERRYRQMAGVDPDQIQSRFSTMGFWDMFFADWRHHG
jgi:hypothetical protein